MWSFFFMLAVHCTVAHLEFGGRKVAHLFGRKSQTERQKMHVRASSHCFWLWSRCLYRRCMCICLASSRYPGVFVCGRICPHVNVHESVRARLCPCTYIISVFLVMESNGFTGTLWNADEHLFGRKVSAHAPAPCLSLSPFPVKNTHLTQSAVPSPPCAFEERNGFVPGRINSGPKHL